MRMAPSRDLIEALIGAGAKVQAFDPKAMDEARRIGGFGGFGDGPDILTFLQDFAVGNSLLTNTAFD